MEDFKYRGRVITASDIEFINELIAKNPSLSRWKLSFKLCEAWDWRQQNGVVRDMVARGLMLKLHRAELIQLPETRNKPKQPLGKAKVIFQDFDIDQSLVHMPLPKLGPLEFMLVRRTKLEPLFESLIHKHHYLGYVRPVGAHLKYMVYAGNRPIACLTWCSAARKLAARDKHIGWSAQAREKNIHMIAYNTRYLIMPWVNVPHLASHILGKMAKLLKSDWLEKYGYELNYLETFIDPALYKGTCYKAANWKYLGRTTGRGKNAPSKAQNRSIKEILAYPLHRKFAERMGAV